MMSPSTSAIDTFILLFCLLSSFSHISCHDTVTGNNRQGRKCESGKYLLQKPGGLKCQRCTLMCDGQKNQMEVTSCSQERNRVCFCKPGFYCSEGNKYNTYCHNACIPCATGTFSSKPSLTSSCTPHTDCEKLGMKVLKEGSTTQDRECVSDTKTAPATTKHSTTSFSNDIITNPSNTITSSSPSAPKSSNAITNSSSSAIISSNTSTTRSSKDNRANSSSSSANFSSTTITSSFSTDIISSNAIAVSSKAGSTASPVHMPKENQTQWFMLFIILMLILCMTGFCVLLKGKTKKTLSKCFGFINGKHDDKHGCGQMDFQAYALMDCTGEDEMPLGGDVREVKGQRSRTAPPSGGVQQVTMEHKGKGENVSNTVGSIYIYSPGMVILGSGSGDKKEDAGVCEEAVPFMSTPQQESNPPLQELRIQMSTQEQADEELSLSFPVPATGK